MSLNEFMMITIKICIPSNTKIILEENQLRQKYKINNTSHNNNSRLFIHYNRIMKHTMLLDLVKEITLIRQP